MKQFKLIYGYFTDSSKTTFKVLETLVNQGDKKLCSYVLRQKKQTGCYNQHKFKIVSENGLKYNYKFKY